MNSILLMILILVPPSLCVVNCRTACLQCHEQDQQHAEILEVYCAMCKECVDHRREKKLREDIVKQDIIYNLEDRDECPPPPPCETEPGYVSPYTTPQKLLSPTTIRITTTTIETTTTTRRPCPTAPPCKIERPSPSPCYPCMPMCPCPYPQLYSSPGPQPLAETYTAAPTTTKSTGYLYVYIGVPRDMLEKELPISRNL